VIARQFLQSKTGSFEGCSQWLVPSKTDAMTDNQGHGHLPHGEQRLACLVLSHRRATVAQITEKRYAAHDRKVSEHIVSQFAVYGAE